MDDDAVPIHGKILRFPPVFLRFQGKLRQGIVFVDLQKLTLQFPFTLSPWCSGTSVVCIRHGITGIRGKLIFKEISFIKFVKNRVYLER